jgi:hypothetical protein
MVGTAITATRTKKDGPLRFCRLFPRTLRARQTCFAGVGKANGQKKRVTVTIISRPVKLVDSHPEVSEPTMIYSGSVIDFSETRRRLSAEFEWDKETETKLQHGKALVGHKYSVEPANPLKLAFYFVILLAALISLLVAIKEFAAPRMADTDQLRLAVRDVPNQGAVTFDQAMQALSGRR